MAVLLTLRSTMPLAYMLCMCLQIYYLSIIYNVNQLTKRTQRNNNYWTAGNAWRYFINNAPDFLLSAWRGQLVCWPDEFKKDQIQILGSDLPAKAICYTLSCSDIQFSLIFKLFSFGFFYFCFYSLYLKFIKKNVFNERKTITCLSS